MYPAPNVITYSDNLLGSAPFYSIFRFLGFDRETSFQWWFVVMFILNYSCCYFFLNWCFKNKYAAVLGAMVFAFSMALQSQMTHAQTFPRYPIPLAFLMCLLFMRDLKPIYFFFALFFVVYQFYCGIYLGFLLSVPIALLLIFIYMHKRDIFLQKFKSKKWSRMIIASVILNIIIFLPLMIPYITNGMGHNSYGSIVSTIPTIKSYFFSQGGSLFWNFLNATCNKYTAWWDHQIFPGGIAMICILIFSFFIIAKIINKNSFGKISIDYSLIILFITGLITFLLFLRFQNFSFYKIVKNLPGFGSMRSITRIINIELIFFAIATAFVFSILLKKQNIFSVLIFIFLAGFLIADNYYKEGTSYRTEKAVSQKRVDNLIAKMKNIPKGSIVSYEPDQYDDAGKCQIDAMLASQTLNLKTVNGYSGNSPAAYSPFWFQLNRKAREDWFKSIEFKPDTVYVVH
jgi:hypothetical protein